MDACGASLAWLQDVHKFCAESDKFSVRMADNIATMDQNMIALDKEVEQLGSRLHQFKKYVLDNFQRLEAKVDCQVKVSHSSTPKPLPCLYSVKISTLETRVATLESTINGYKEEFARAHETIMALQTEQTTLRDAVSRLSKTTMSVESELCQRSLQMDNSNVHNRLARMEAQIQLLETKGCKCISSSWQTSSSMCTDHYEDAADTSEEEGEQPNRRIPEVFTTLPSREPFTPKATPRARRSYMADRQSTASPCQPTKPAAVNKQFKPLNLPKFNKQGNINSFLRLFKMAMRGASNHQKATTLIITLDAISVNLVMPRLPATNWTYQEARQAVLEEFGREDILFTRKSKFGAIKFAPGKTPGGAAPQELHRAMAPAYAKGKDILEIVDCLCSHAKTFGPPNQPKSKQPKPTYKKPRFQKEDPTKSSAHPPDVKGPYCIA
ncbi:hypothetical protein DSO57_1030237 [Entomophthora muscae]|uniref:Uncharacterized protein n=1 Tax=Entomophthora muscae TaxID=34485 RepID=A0ACC2TZJ6_9FUNG|nr:hypothetical protein DSO57_1030237 [Entomophthora muscae]